MAGARIFSKSARTRQEIGTQFLFALARREPFGIVLTTLFAQLVAARIFPAEHSFVLRDLATTFGHANADGFAWRWFFATGHERSRNDRDDGQDRRADSETHEFDSRPDRDVVVNALGRGKRKNA